MPIIRRRRVRQSLIWIAALILFLSSAAMLAIFVILPFAFDLRVMLGPMQAAILGLATSSALALLILYWIHSRRQKQENKDAWLTDEHVNLMISGLEDYAIFFLDSDGTVISWNNGAAKIKGYQSDEILGQNFSVFYTEEDIAEGLPNQNLKKALEKGKLRAEGWRLRKDGTRFRADVLITPYHDEQENLKAYAKITRDISRWYDVHTRLEESERQLEEAQRVAHIGSWEWDLENDELSWSKELKRIYGRDLESFQPTIEAYLDSIPDEERDRVAKTIDRSFETGEPLELEHRIVRPDGEIRTIYARGQVQIDAEGKPIRLHGIGQDITDRVHLERSYLIQAELNQIVVRAQSDLGQGVLIIEDGLILFSNDALQEIFEIPGEVIESVDQFLALVELDETSNLGRILTTTPLEMGRLHRGNQFVNGENGKHFEFAATSMQVDHHSRRVVLIQDITERRELQLMLEESREKLRRYSAELNRAVEEERATISRRIHDELGQQLTGLRMDLSAMYSRASDSNHPDLLYVSKKISEMTDLIDETIATVRKLATELRPGILDDIGLTAALEWQASEFEKRTKIKCEFQSSDIAPINEEAATALFRITQEALTNVSRHAEAERVKIQLKSNDHQIILEVRDDGKGISPESLLDVGKTSLGILGMHERAEILGGKTIVTPRASQGTIVHVSIPIDQNSKGV